MALEGETYHFTAMEFRIDVNPVIGQDIVRTIEPGSVQPIRYVLQTKGYPRLKSGRGFIIAWWIDGDDPMKLLKSLEGKDLSCSDNDDVSLHYTLELDGKEIICNDGCDNRFTIDTVEENTISGTFEGEYTTKGVDGYVPVRIEGGSFEASITKMFRTE
ncbi:hypothetical protein ACFL6M_06855 [Candidatus Eisenbacteria bacterium]|uniref:Phage tail protein n=1 Tax=Eiseniibacteriota bacterium TaxID=2212470 RepID=A0ABV6YLT4_UNCEI